MYLILINRLGGLSLSRNSVVRLTDRPEMTIVVYHGGKAIKQQQQPVGISRFRIYSRLSLSRTRRDLLKHFEISVFRHIRFVVLRKKQFELPNFTNDYVIGLLKLEIYMENIVEKGRNCSPGAISPLFHNIL